jgi:hypothetical protein
MQTIRILEGHNLHSLVEESQLFEAADLNNIGITEALVPGVTLTIPDQVIPSLVQERLEQKIKPVLIKPVAGQTWVDMALQLTADESRVFELCDANSSGITDELQPTTFINGLTPEPSKRKMVNVLATLKPSSLHYKTGDPAPEGIEYWAIEIDFIVS